MTPKPFFDSCNLDSSSIHRLVLKGRAMPGPSRACGKVALTITMLATRHGTFVGNEQQAVTGHTDSVAKGVSTIVDDMSSLRWGDGYAARANGGS